MNIKNIFDMARADKYTKDGREEIIKAQETEDAYQVGQISEKTGLQKQPDGSWAPPKGGNPAGGKRDTDKTDAVKTFNKITGSKESNFDELKAKYDEAKAKNTGKPAKEPKQNYMGMSKAAALNFAKESGSTAFLMKNAKGEYAVANSADEFNEAEANGYEGAMEELRPDTPREQRKLPNRGGDYLAERLNSFYRDEEDIKSNLEGTGFELLDFTNEHATVQNQAGSQFELKFSAHGDGHDFGVESVKRIYDDPDDDTTDAAPLTGDTKIRVKK